MPDTVPTPDDVPDELGDDDVEDVSGEYRDCIEYIVEHAHNRATPLPIRYVVAYTSDDDDQIAFQCIVDTTDVLDESYGFEIVLDEATASDYESGDSSAAGMIDQQLSMVTHDVTNELWRTIVDY